MKVEEAITFFSSLSIEEKKEFLALLSHELTILGRDSYEIGTDDFTNPAQMRAINEIQHRIAFQLLGLIKRDEGNYSDENLIEMIIKHSLNENFERKAVWAFEQAMNRFSVAV